jgi:hypothetical protein
MVLDLSLPDASGFSLLGTLQRRGFFRKEYKYKTMRSGE